MKPQLQALRWALILMLFTRMVGSPRLSAQPWAAPAQNFSEDVWLGDDLRLVQLGAGLFRHVSEHSIDGRPAPANGLLLVTRAGVVLIDTPWTSDQTRRLVIWAEEELQAPVTHVVVTHFHPDCMGGIAIAHERQIPTYGSVRTAELAAAEGQPPPRTLFESVKTLKVGDETLELFAPGAGHAPDNIVVWLAERRVLFGGCLIRSAAARRLGHLGVADLERWPATLDRVQQRYGEPALIVPGHGSPGGVELIDKTRRLLAEAN